MAEIQGSGVALSYTSDLTGATGWKEVVCMEDTEYQSTSEVNKRRTKCGTIVGVSNPEGQITGSGVAESAPTTGLASHKELHTLHINKTKVLWKFEDETTPANLYISAEGYLTQFNMSAPEGEAVSFTFTIDLTGVVDDTPAA
jgi:hypothetical protein